MWGLIDDEEVALGYCSCKVGTIPIIDLQVSVYGA